MQRCGRGRDAPRHERELWLEIARCFVVAIYLVSMQLLYQPYSSVVDISVLHKEKGPRVHTDHGEDDSQIIGNVYSALLVPLRRNWGELYSRNSIQILGQKGSKS